MTSTRELSTPAGERRRDLIQGARFKGTGRREREGGGRGKGEGRGWGWEGREALQYATVVLSGEQHVARQEDGANSRAAAQ